MGNKTKKLVKGIDFKAMSKPELIKIIEESMMVTLNPEQYKDMVMKKMPEFVKLIDTKEDMANSIYEANQEFMLVLIDCLKRYHKWSDQEIRQLHKELTDVLTGVKEFEDSGLSILSPHDVAIVGDKIEEKGVSGLMKEIAEHRYMKNKSIRSGIELPVLEKLAKQLEKPSR